MASNLFLLKGWTVTLIAALFALAASESQDRFFFLAYIPALMFWGLDGYFLSQERRFRSLYEHVAKLDESQIDFSMDTEPFKDVPRNRWLHAMLSRTLFIYYVVLAITMLFVMKWLK